MNNYIKKIRKERNISRIELSKHSRVPLRTIEDWENGRRKPRDVYQLKKVADALGCSIEELIKWDEFLPDRAAQESEE